MGVLRLYLQKRVNLPASGPAFLWLEIIVAYGGSRAPYRIRMLFFQRESLLVHLLQKLRIGVLPALVGRHVVEGVVHVLKNPVGRLLQQLR